jgi:hypothetical protein
MAMRVTMKVTHELGEWVGKTVDCTPESLEETIGHFTGLMPARAYLVLETYDGKRVLLPGKVAGEAIYTFNVEE